MFEAILLALIIVLFFQVFRLNDKIDYLAHKINQAENKKDFNINQSYTPQETTQKQEENKVMAAFAKQSEEENLGYPAKEEIKQEPFFKENIENETQAYTQNTPVKEEIIVNEEIKIEEKESSPALQLNAAKLFSWIAGFAFILAVIFGLVYAVQNEIISKQMITAAAALTGLILLGTGLLIKDEDYKTASGTLCASGITTFFIATYCAFSLYNMMSLSLAFVLMAMISFVSFIISAKKDIQFISFLGMLAAFLTPLLLSSGNDNYIFFFTYIAFINGAAIAVALKKGWNNLLITSLLFTFLCQLAWIGRDFNPARANILQITFTLYSIALSATYINLRAKLPDFIKYVFSAFIILGALTAIPLIALIIMFAPHSAVLINIIIMLAISQALILVLYYIEPKIFKIPSYIMGAVFLLALMFWTQTDWTTQAGGLLLVLIIMAASLANSLIVSLKTKEAFAPFLNLITLFIIFLMITRKNIDLTSLYMVHNSAIIFNLILAFIAYNFRNKLPELTKTAFGTYLTASLIFTLVFISNYRITADLSSILFNTLLVNISLLMLCYKDKEAYKMPFKVMALGVLIIFYFLTGKDTSFAPFAFGAYLIFGAINLTCALQLEDKKEPSIFPLVLAGFWFLAMFETTNMYYIWFAMITINMLCLSLAKVYKMPALSFVAALGSSYLCIFYAHDGYKLILACVFALLFYIHPLLSKNDFEEEAWQPWLASALMAFTAWCIIIDSNTFAISAHKGFISLIFAAFYLVESALIYNETLLNKYKSAFTILSMATIFFITAGLSFIFTNQWLTLALAAEGAALIYLNKQIPTSWGRKVGFGLLALVFLRLIILGDFGPYHTFEAKIFNWYLFVYGLCSSAMFVAAKYWQEENSQNNTAKNLLNIAGANLLFLLIDIEIANYFGNTGTRLKFNFFGNFAATITYTIAWTLYGAAACFIAFCKRHKTLLNIGVVIMSLAIVKLFLFDLWSLGILYRIIGLFAMAGILFGISLIFQNFKNQMEE